MRQRKMAPTQTREVDAPFQSVVESLPRCTNLLRAWADKLEKRHEQFCSLEGDFGALFSHTEQLSSELEKSRPNAPVYKNAGDALKKAVSRTAKVLKEMLVSLEAIKGELSPPSQYESIFDSTEKCLSECYEYAEAYRESCQNFDVSGDGAAAVDKKERKEKKKDKEKKRSNSPKRSREREKASSSLMA
jgi:chaperonin cofactor prefoldin